MVRRTRFPSPFMVLGGDRVGTLFTVLGGVQSGWGVLGGRN